MIDLNDYSAKVLENNDAGEWTIPAKGMYPHQWLWDSCFTAMGLRHVNPQRAALELLSLLRGQWQNGMIPHMIFSRRKIGFNDETIWDSRSIDSAPRDVGTSGITQPALIAQATQLVAEKLPTDERQQFLAQMVPAIIRHHAWLYTERDVSGDALVMLLHPWETGLDNSPSWTVNIKDAHTPHWVRAFDLLRMDRIINYFRRDLHHTDASQRMKTLDLLRLYHAQQDLRRHGYDTAKVMQNPHRHFTIESLGFNSILIRNNEILRELADEANIKIEPWLLDKFKQAIAGLTKLCNPDTGICYHRNFDKHMIEETPTITVLFPLYAGVMSKRQNATLVGLLTNTDLYWPDYPVPSVPLDSKFFNEKRYWQGPTWLNTNWLIIDGLKRAGYQKEADVIKQKSIELVARQGAHEYFSPITGQGYGANNFSWTAAVTLDLLNS